MVTRTSRQVPPRAARRGTLTAVALVAALALAAGVQASQAPAGERLTDARMVAVVPLANGGASQDDWIGIGIVETLRFAFPRLVPLQDAAPGRPSRTVARMAADAGVTWILTGEYDRTAEGLRIAVRVVHAATGETVERAIVNGAGSDLFLLQDRLVDRVATALAALPEPSRAAAGTAPRTPAERLPAAAPTREEAAPTATPPEPRGGPAASELRAGALPGGAREPAPGAPRDAPATGERTEASDAEVLLTDAASGRPASALPRSGLAGPCLLYTSPSPRDGLLSRMPSSA